MVRLKEKQIKNITILDFDGYGSITASDSRITDLAIPEDGYDAATKNYVDMFVGTSLSVTARGESNALTESTITINAGLGPDNGIMVLDLPNINIGDGSFSKNITVGAQITSASDENLDNTIIIGSNIDIDTNYTTTNILIGSNILANSTVNNTVLIGHESLNDNTAAIQSVVLGYNSANDMIIDNSIVIGALSGSNGNMTESIVIGNRAGENLTSPISYNVVIGTYAGNSLRGDSNTIIGQNAAYNFSGERNVCLGVFAGYNTGSNDFECEDDVRIGNNSGSVSLTQASVGNILIGRQSGPSYDGGEYNIILGYNSGDSFTNGNYNTLIGYNTKTSVIGSKNSYINIADLYFGETSHGSGSSKAAIGNLGILLTPPDVSIQIPQLLVYANAEGDNSATLGLKSLGSNSAEIDFYVGDRDPSGNVSPNAGDIYIRSDGYNSSIYQYDGYVWSIFGAVSLEQVLLAGNTTNGTDINLTGGSVILSTSGSVIIDDNAQVNGDFTIDGKLTVTGLIDPTGMVFDIQETLPGGIPGSNKATLWVNEYSLPVLTDDTGLDHLIENATITDGYNEQVNEGFSIKRYKKFSNPIGTSDPFIVNIITAEELEILTENMGSKFGTAVKAWAFVTQALGSGGCDTAFATGIADFWYVQPNQISDHKSGTMTISIDFDEENGIGIICTPTDADGYLWILDVEIITTATYDNESVFI